jgi:uncharacterized protein
MVIASILFPLRFWPMIIPISTLFIGLHGILAFILSYIAARERVKARVWHGESQKDVLLQKNPLNDPSGWVKTVEQLSQKYEQQSPLDEGALQRKVRAHGNFAEYVPQGLLFLIALEVAQAPSGLVWGLGTLFFLARIAHAIGLLTTYGPSIARAIGFFSTWMVYLIGSFACLYFGLQQLIA